MDLASGQVIYSREVAWGLETFGWSLSGGFDMDNNLYADVVVGAYLSNTAVILRLVEFQTLNLYQACLALRSGAVEP